MLERLLLGVKLIFTMMYLKRVSIETMGGDAGTSRQPSLGINNRVSTLRSLNELRILRFEDGEVLFCFPVPNRIRSEEEVHFLEGALVGLWVKSPDHRNGDDVAGCKDVESLFTERGEHDGAKESLAY